MFLWDGASASHEALSPIVSESWIVPLSHDMCACVGWCVRLRGVLSCGLASHCVPTCLSVLGCASSFPSSRLHCIVSDCLPGIPHMYACDGAPAFQRSCLPLSSSLSPCLSFLASKLVFQLVPLLVSLCGEGSHFCILPQTVYCSGCFPVLSDMFDIV